MRWIHRAANAVGTPTFLFLSIATVASGFLWGYSDKWWDWIDKAIYIVTLWLAIIVQAAQNRDTQAIQKKLDELIRAIPPADDSLRGIEK